MKLQKLKANKCNWKTIFYFDQLLILLYEKIFRNNKNLGKVIRVYVVTRCDKRRYSVTNRQTAIRDMACHYYQPSDCDIGHGLTLLTTVRLRYGTWLCQLSDCYMGHGLRLLSTFRLRYRIWLDTTANLHTRLRHMA